MSVPLHLPDLRVTDLARLPKPDPVPVTSTTIAGLSGLVGTHLGYTSWHGIAQERVDHFAEATLDDLEAWRGRPVVAPSS